MPFFRSTPSPASENGHVHTGPPESTRLIVLIAEKNEKIENLEAQRTSLQRDSEALSDRYNTAIEAELQGLEGEDPAAIRSERERVGDKLAGNERLRKAAEAERDQLTERLRAVRAEELREARALAFEEAKEKATDKKGRFLQGYAALCILLAELNLDWDACYGDFAEIGGPRFAEGMKLELETALSELQRAGWNFVSGRGSVETLLVVSMMPGRSTRPM